LKHFAKQIPFFFFFFEHGKHTQPICIPNRMSTSSLPNLCSFAVGLCLLLRKHTLTY